MNSWRLLTGSQIALAAFITGCAMPLVYEWQLMALVAISIALMALFWPRLGNLLVAFLFFSFGAYYVSHYRAQIITTPSSIEQRCFQIVRPAWESKSTNAYLRDCEGKRRYLYKEEHDLPSGQRLIASGRLIPVENFSDFNYQSFLASNGVFGVLELEQDSLQLVERHKDFFAIIEEARKGIVDYYQETFTPEQAALANGLMIGYRVGFSDEMEEAMRNTGTTHIVAISGYNVSVVIMLVFGICLGFGIKRAFAIAILAIFVFIFLTGAEPSIIRAGILGILLLGAKGVGRRAFNLYIILITASVMLLINPLLIAYNSGFQLSFGAFAGIIYLTPRIDTWLVSWPLPAVVRQAIATTLGAQIAVAPLLLQSFGYISSVALLSNALILPLVPPAMFFAFVSFVSAKLPLVSDITSAGSALLLSVINYLIVFFNQFGARIELSWPSSYTFFFYSLFILLLYVYKRRSDKATH